MLSSATEWICGWICGWIPYFQTEVDVKIKCCAIQCNVRTEICLICPKNPADNFTSVENIPNNIKVLEPQNNSTACEIIRVDERTLAIYFTASKVGVSTILLNIGNSFRFTGVSAALPVTVRPSCPAKLVVEKSIPDTQIFVGRTTEVELRSYDYYGNEASACEHKVMVESDPIDAVSLEGSKIRYGKYFITLKCNMKCRAQVKIQVGSAGKQIDSGHVCPAREADQGRSTVRFPLDISYPPISVEKSTMKIMSPPLNQIKAGEPITLEVNIRDIFGQPIHSEVDCDVSAVIGPTSQCCPDIQKFRNKRLLKIIQPKAGLHPVNVTLKRILLNPCQPLEVDVLPSLVSCLSNLRTSGCSPPEDPNFEPESNVLYYGDWCSLQADITDKYGNIATQVTNVDKCVFHLATLDSDESETKLQTKDLKLDKGKIAMKFRPQQLGKQKLVVRLSNKMNMNLSVSQTTEINVVESPYSPFISQQKFNKEHSEPITAGSEYKFEFKVYDVFGNAIRQDSTVACNVSPQLIPKQLEESVKLEKDSESAFLVYNATVVTTLAGTRQVKLVVNADDTRSITRLFQVISSSPHHLNNLQFKTTPSSKPNVLRMEADVVDEHENIVTAFDENCEINLYSLDDQGNKTRVSCDGGRLHVDVNMTDVKKQHFSIISNTPKDEYELQNIKFLQATEALHFSVVSPREESSTLTAGSGYKFHVSVLKAVVAIETANPAAISKPSGDTGRGGIVEVSVIFKKAGERRLEVFVDEKKTLRAKLQVKPDLDNVLCEHITERPVSERPAFTKESLTLTTTFADRFGNKVPLDGSRFVQKSGPKSGLQVTTEPTNVEVNPGSRASRIDYQFVKQGTYVVSLQYPNRNGHHSDVDEFTINVQDAPLDPQHSYVTWSPEFAGMEDQPLFQDDDHFKCRLNLKDVLNHDFMGDVESADLSVVYNGKEATILKRRSFDHGELEAIVPLDGFQICSTEMAGFSFIFDGHKITRPLQLPFKSYLEYDEKQCGRKQVTRHQDRTTTTEAFECKAVTVEEMEGEDNSHLDNIKRICHPAEITMSSTSSTPSTLLILPQSFPRVQLGTCHEALLHLLKALYCRQQATEADREREKWKERADETYHELMKMTTIKRKTDERPSFCRKIKEKYGNLMRDYNSKACDEIFAFFNLQRDQNHIDLHGLLVADEEKLKEYETQLLEKKTEDEVKEIIEKKREEGDEAIRKVRERLDTFDSSKARKDRKTWLEIIVGCGHHSRIKGRQKIRPKVEEYLKKNILGGFSIVNEGALVVTFEDYPSNERCFGEYYCQNCKKGWKSGRSFKNKWQGCHRCFEKDDKIQECLPLKQCPLQLQYSGRGNRQTKADGDSHSKLCQKCIELGSPCTSS